MVPASTDRGLQFNEGDAIGKEQSNEKPSVSASGPEGHCIRKGSFLRARNGKPEDYADTIFSRPLVMLRVALRVSTSRRAWVTISGQL
jgi:hypothetical protein